jgi:chromosome condensin MukBEF complex kleisin-like MukF subunit
MVEPTVANVLDLIMMEQRIKDQQNKNEIKEPLVELLDSDDQASVEEGEKEKIACVDFKDYKRKQQAQRMHEDEE